MMFKYYITLLLLTISIQLSAAFRFVVITDMHVQLAHNESSVDLENAIRDINNQGDIDFVLIAGDVTENGDSASLVKAKTILSSLNKPYSITFGNHDMISSDPGRRIYISVFGTDRFSFTHKGVHFIGFTTGPVLQRGIGHVSTTDLNWIQSQLSKTDFKIPVIALTHYPMQQGDVDNWYELTDILRKFNVQALLNGHYHRNALLSYDGIPGIVCRSALSKNGATGGYTIFTVTDSLQVSEKIINAAPSEWLVLPIEQKKYELPDPTLRK